MSNDADNPLGSGIESEGIGLLLPGELPNGPRSPEERLRIAVELVKLRSESDPLITDLLKSAGLASEAAASSFTNLEARLRTAVTIAVVGTMVTCVLLAVVLIFIAVRVGV